MSQPDIAFCDERKETTNNKILWQLGITDPFFAEKIASEVIVTHSSPKNSSDYHSNAIKLLTKLGDHGKHISKVLFARKVEIPEQKENQLAVENNLYQETS